MPMNLVQHRSEPNVWDRADAVPWDAERWIAALAAGGCLVAGYSAPRPRNYFMALAGGLLGWWAAASCEERALWRGRALAALPGRRRSDVITEASQDSFPASDAPSFTSSTGNTLGTSRVMR
jgi:hypothetical protein